MGAESGEPSAARARFAFCLRFGLPIKRAGPQIPGGCNLDGIFLFKKVVRLEVATTRDADALPFGEVLPDSCPSRQGFAVVKQNEFMNHSWNMLQQSSWYNCTCV